MYLLFLFSLFFFIVRDALALILFILSSFSFFAHATGAMMCSVALFALMWSLHDFVLPQVGDMAGLLGSINTQIAAFSDWRVVAAIAWTGKDI